MKPVLVTGGSGYIGSQTAQELVKEGDLVIVLDNLTTGHRDAVRAQHFYEGDIADTALVEHIVKEHQIQSVIHFAAKSLVSESFAKPELYFHENTVKSFKFFEAAIKAGVKHVLFIYSRCVWDSKIHSHSGRNGACSD